VSVSPEDIFSRLIKTFRLLHNKTLKGTVIIMVKLTEQMKEDLKKVKVLPLATCSRSGVPNVIPIGICELVEKDDDDYLLLMNNYFLKTMANINENPKVAIFVWSPEVTACFQMKGDVIEIADSGKEYEDFIGRVKAVKPQLPGKHMVVVRITDVFNCKSGETAGQKIL